jgi:SPOR domain
MNDDNVTLPDDEPDQPTEVQPAADGETPESAPEPVIPTCAECGEPIDEDQPYCLECGAPTPTAPKLRRRLGPAGILAVGLGVLGIGAGTLAYALAKDDKPTALASTGLTNGTISLPDVSNLPSTFSSATTAPPVDLTDTETSDFPTGSTTFPPVSVPPTGSTTAPTTSTFVPQPPTTTIAPPTNTIDPEPSTTRTTTPPTSGATDTWRDGVSAWTVIVASATDQAAAIAFRNKVNATGRSAGLIESDLYSTLSPGLWVVFVGEYTSRATALSQAATLRATYSDAYAQRIEE